jgi:hypothetical protein
MPIAANVAASLASYLPAPSHQMPSCSTTNVWTMPFAIRARFSLGWSFAGNADPVA